METLPLKVTMKESPSRCFGVSVSGLGFVTSMLIKTAHADPGWRWGHTDGLEVSRFVLPDFCHRLAMGSPWARQFGFTFGCHIIILFGDGKRRAIVACLLGGLEPAPISKRVSERTF